MSDIRSFPSKWGTGAKKSYFPSLQKFPYPFKERARLADVMTVDQILNTTEAEENSEVRRQRKWKEIRNLYKIISSTPGCHGSMENAMWMYGDKKITVDHFVTAMIAEFKFDDTARMDNHLRWLYWAFEGGHHDTVDWRVIQASFKCLVFFRLIRNKPFELFGLLFDIFTDHTHKHDHEYTAHEEHWQLPIISEPMLSNPIFKILVLPCEADHEFAAMAALHASAIEDLKAQEIYRLSRSNFIHKLLKPNPSIVQLWQRQLWERLPNDLRLIYYRESEMDACLIAESLIGRVKLNDALLMYQTNLRNRHFFLWKTLTSEGVRLRMFQRRKIHKKGRLLIRFWREMTAYRTRKRRRRMLAEVMGAYTLKARAFARIKLFNYTNRKIWLFSGHRDTWVKNINQGLGYVRSFVRLWTMRKGFHRWWDQIRSRHNLELAEDHNWVRAVRRLHTAWRNWAHTRAMNRRNEIMAVDNQMALERMLKDSENAANELLELEKARDEAKKKAADDLAKEQKEKRLAEAKAMATFRKLEGKEILLSIQHEARRKRVKKEAKHLRKKFEAKWAKKKEEMITRNKIVMTAYMENPANKLTIQMRMEKLKNEFLAPPTPENPEKEATLTSPKNIVFLYLEQKLTEMEMSLLDAIAKFDKENRGYLLYAEFERLIKSLGVKLNPAQVSEVIRGVDADGDGFIDVGELEASMKEATVLGVPGSPWKFYVDPAQDVICYHNMATNEKVFEYNMTDAKLMEITQSNIFAEATTQTLAKVEADKIVDWKITQEDYYVRKLQYLYRQWAGRKHRNAQLWKVERGNERKQRKIKKKIAKFITWHYFGIISRKLFSRQLKMNYEKVWDMETGRLFWYNHITQTSTWDRPHLLWRYDDVENPSPWVCVDAQDPDTGEWKLHYFHVPAKTDLPRKPDGLLVCQYCYRNLAARHCNECNVDFCFACHRDTHRHPMGFFQKRKMKTKEGQDTKFLERMRNYPHTWKLTKPLMCVMCQSEHQYAAWRCKQCKCDFCRACSRRVHTKDQANHDLEAI